MSSHNTKRFVSLSLVFSALLASQGEVGASKSPKNGQPSDEQTKLRIISNHVSSTIGGSELQLQLKGNKKNHEEKLLRGKSKSMFGRESQLYTLLTEFKEEFAQDSLDSTLADTSTLKHIRHDAHIDIGPLVGTKWTALQIAFLNSDTVELHPILQGHPITLMFDPKRIVGYAGCNTYRASATITADRIDVRGVATTRMGCPGNEIMEQEHEYIHLLSNRSFSYRILVNEEDDEEELLLQQVAVVDGEDVEGQVLARFVKLPANLDIQK